MSSESGSDLRVQLFNEILMARQRVYAMGEPTPLDRLELPIDADVWVKREDFSSVHSYKWRGAYNRMALLTPEERRRGVITASAGNHAQGVALAARTLRLNAKIFMPASTPRMKQKEVARHGGTSVEVILHGDTYDDAANAAWEVQKEEDRVFIHPYDDLATMGGQGTLADEIVMSGKGPFDVAYIQIGGGGLAAAVACWLKAYYPRIKIVGVEGTDQASMAAAQAAGKPVALDYLDVFCDGTAVRKVGKLTYPLCKELVDEYMTVTNEEVSAAIQIMWNMTRSIPEPAGAMGLAGIMKHGERLGGKRVLCILCGANMDFGHLSTISAQAGFGARRRKFYRFTIPEGEGTLIKLLGDHTEGVNIIDLQYGKSDEEVAWPVFGFEASPQVLEKMARDMKSLGIDFEDVTHQEDVDFRIINYEPHSFHDPYFILYNFPERAGALRELLDQIRTIAGICYFNYSYSGERVGRALIGFEFAKGEHREELKAILDNSGRNYREIPAAVIARISGIQSGTQK